VNTPTHAALNFLVLGRRPGAPRGWIVTGAILPDLPMYAFFVLQVYVFREPWEEIWRRIYFQPNWQTVFDAFHSIPIFLVIGAWFCWRRNPRGEVFAVSLLMHSLVDWPTHLEDAHAYFWPIWRQPMHGVMSYWHPGSPMWMVELSLLFAAGAWRVAERMGSGVVCPKHPRCKRLPTPFRSLR
jgi:hypothetical protein